MNDKSSSQFAFENNISLQEYYYFENDKHVDVYHSFKYKGIRKVGKRFHDKVHSLSCFPFSFSSNTSRSKLKMVLDRNAFILGFLNKSKSNTLLIKYIDIVLSNKYYMINHNLYPEYFEMNINNGKDKELEEMEFEKRKYVWDKDYRSLSKQVKIEIMNRDRFKEIVSANTDKIFNAVTNLLDNYSDFITVAIVAKHAGMNEVTTRKYIEVYREEIDSHNKSKYGTSNHNEYLTLLSKEDVTNAVFNLKFHKKKVNIQSVSTYTGLHRNTVSKINKKYQLF